MAPCPPGITELLTSGGKISPTPNRSGSTARRGQADRMRPPAGDQPPPFHCLHFEAPAAESECLMLTARSVGDQEIARSTWPKRSGTPRRISACRTASNAAGPQRPATTGGRGGQARQFLWALLPASEQRSPWEWHHNCRGTVPVSSPPRPSAHSPVAAPQADGGGWSQLRRQANLRP